MSESLEKVLAAMAALSRGELIVVADSEDRENEGDLVGAAALADSRMVNFMATWGRGLICVPMTQKRAEELELPLMVLANHDTYKTAFTISVDEISVGTGISTEERARTVRSLADPSKTAFDFKRPGHIFPLIACAGGLKERHGHTEAGVELVQAAGLFPAALICEILNEDGSMARRDELKIFARKYNLIYITMEEIILWFTKETSSEPA